MVRTRHISIFRSTRTFDMSNLGGKVAKKEGDKLLTKTIRLPESQIKAMDRKNLNISKYIRSLIEKDLTNG